MKRERRRSNPESSALPWIVGGALGLGALYLFFANRSPAPSVAIAPTTAGSGTPNWLQPAASAAGSLLGNIFQSTQSPAPSADYGGTPAGSVDASTPDYIDPGTQVS